MTNKSTELTILQGLLKPLNEQLDAIHASWSSTFVDGFRAMEGQFHEIGNVLTLANLPMFAKLAYLLKTACQQLGEQNRLSTAVAPEVLYASKLLQYELNRYVLTGQGYQGLTLLRMHYIESLLFGNQDNKAVWSTVMADGRFSDQFSRQKTDMLALSVSDYQKLSTAWRYTIQILLETNQNNKEALALLLKIAESLKTVSRVHSLRTLWSTVVLWLDSLQHNEEPLPRHYAYLLSELDRTIGLTERYAGDVEDFDDIETVVWLENRLVDIYVQLSTITHTTEPANELLSVLNSSLSKESSFFPHILSVIEGVIFAFGKGDISVQVLEDIKEQLGERGWGFYESYVAQIIEDVKVMDGNSQLQWQITSQLQDLYSAILTTHSAIESNIGESSAYSTDQASSALRQVRTLIEQIKVAFSDYLHTNQVESLPDEAVFANLTHIFEEMSMYDVGAVAEALSRLFDMLRQQEPAELSWSFAHAAADSLSLFELFLDGLAKQIFDDALLIRAKSRLYHHNALHCRY